MNRERLTALRKEVGEFVNLLDVTAVSASTLYDLVYQDPRDLTDLGDIMAEIDNVRFAWEDLALEWEVLEQDHLEEIGG